MQGEHGCRLTRDLSIITFLISNLLTLAILHLHYHLNLQRIILFCSWMIEVLFTGLAIGGETGRGVFHQPVNITAVDWAQDLVIVGTALGELYASVDERHEMEEK